MIKLLALLAISFAAVAQTPTVAAIQNVGDFGTTISPGVLAVIYGTNFGSTGAGVSITVGGKLGYVEVVTPTQITAQLPVDAPIGATTLTVTVNSAASAPFPITLAAFAPALFSADGSGGGAGLIRNAANAQVTNTNLAKPGDALTAYATGLGPTTPATPTGTAAAANRTTTKPTLTVGGANAVISYAGISPGSPALYQINFTVPAGVQGTVQVAISIGGMTSKPLTLALFGISAVVNNASFKTPGTAVAGSLFSVFANGLGTTDQSIGFPSTSFQGVSVTFNGVSAPLFHLIATGSQIDLLVPYELPATGTVQVQLITPSGASPNYALTMAPAAPGLYFFTDPALTTRTNAVAQFNNTAWLAIPVSTAAALKIPGNCKAANINPQSLCGEPATAGDYLILYTTGLGLATPNADPNGKTLTTGMLAPADGSILYKTVAMPTVTVGGFPAPVLFSGITPGFTGLYQVDIQVPLGVTGDDVPVVISTPGSVTDTRTIAIQ